MKMFSAIKPFLTKHEPEILMGMGVSGLVAGTIWGIAATFKAARVIDDYKSEHNKSKITAKEALKLTWKYYLPVAATTVLSVPCVIASNRVSNRRYAALATAYTISETAIQEYKDKVVEVVGEKKAREIQDKSNEATIEKTYKGGSQIIMLDKGENLFFEPCSGRYFKSTWNNILKAANELNAKAIGSISSQILLNEWYEMLGLEDTALGNDMGWSLDGNPSNLINLELGSYITKDGTPCACIEYRHNPVMLK